jgi:hypothetical protein
MFMLILLFYGILKMAGNNNIMTIYDNFLFNYRSHANREYLLQYYKYYTQ